MPYTTQRGKKRDGLHHQFLPATCGEGALILHGVKMTIGIVYVNSAWYDCIQCQLV